MQTTDFENPKPNPNQTQTIAPKHCVQRMPGMKCNFKGSKNPDLRRTQHHNQHHEHLTVTLSDLHFQRTKIRTDRNNQANKQTRHRINNCKISKPPWHIIIFTQYELTLISLLSPARRGHELALVSPGRAGKI